MKNKDFKFKKLKEQLRRYKDSGKKVLIWSLSMEQLNFIETLGDTVEPYLYEIFTKRFRNIHAIKFPLLKDIHYQCKGGKKSFVCKLKKEEKKILDEYGVRYRVAKYKIYLTRKKF